MTLTGPVLQLMVVSSLLVQLCLSSSCNTTDITPCTCSYIYVEDYNKVKVDCAGHKLESVPSVLPNDVEILDFTDNYLGYGDLSTLCQYARLEHVSIAKNHITSIDEEAFRKCEISQSLNFTGNVLNSVTSRSLSGLQFTRTLYGLEANHFTEDAFSDMFVLAELEMKTNQNNLSSGLFNKTKLQKLKLEIPHAIDIPNNLLYSLKSTLVEFELKATMLKSIPESIFMNLDVLQTVTLILPDLQSMPDRLFQIGAITQMLEYLTLYDVGFLASDLKSLVNLRYLAIHGDVRFNSDTFIGLHALKNLHLDNLYVGLLNGAFNDLRNVTILTLRNTGITDLNRHVFEPLDSLKFLDISYNGLRTLDTMLFYEVSDTMTQLNLSYNSLKEFTDGLFADNAALEMLDLSENSISEISMSAFVKLTRLKSLHLQNNKLYNIDPTTFAHNVNLFYLDLSSNVLIDLPTELFEKLETLSVLKLSDNKFSNLDRSILFNIPTLNELDLSYNPIQCDSDSLQCTTIEGVDRLKTVSINGVCINEDYSIQDFVETGCETSTINVVESTVVPPTIDNPVNELNTTEVLPVTDQDIVHVVPSHNTSTILNVTFNATEITHPPSFGVEGSSDSNEGPDSTTPDVPSNKTSNTDSNIADESKTSETVYLNEKDVSPSVSSVTTSADDTFDSVLDSEKNVQTEEQILPPRITGDINMSDDEIRSGTASNGIINVTEIPVITNLNRVTSRPSKVESSGHSDGFYISLGSILSVAVVSFLILLYLFYKRRKSRRYEMPRLARFGIEGERFIPTEDDDDRKPSVPSMTPLKEVPSIQIESVDDDGNIRVEYYSESQTGLNTSHNNTPSKVKR